MNFQHYDLGQLRQGATVEITLQGHAANVQLMDSANFQRYKNRQRYEYFGGHATTSVTQLAVPRTGHWHVAIDLGGNGGQVRSNVQVYG